MQDKYDAMRADIISGDMDAAVIMQTTPAETVKSILDRIGIGFEEGLPKDVYVAALKEEFCRSREWILKIIPRNLLDFLLVIWENEQIEIKSEQWEYLQYLQIFGLAASKKGNPVTNEPNIIYCIQEMRDNFYFLLKSKKSRERMGQYEEWEKIICGLIYYYGMVDMVTLHEQFRRVTKCMITYEEFVVFLKCRCSLWSFGLVLKETGRGKEYFQYVNVENAETLLMYINENKDIPYKVLEKKDLIYVSEASGIDNRWKGVSELGTLFLDELHMDYYRAMVMIQSLLYMVQNGCEWGEIKGKIVVIPIKEKALADKVYDAANDLFYNVPIYELKGYSRNECEKIFRQKQLNRKREMFRLIEGKKGKE